jgi:uracil-DNA glycosylase family 4
MEYKTTLEKEKALEQLHLKYKACMACPLALQGRTQVVFGAGNPGAQIVFIGEGPGRDEDLQGHPFVGRSGQLLTKLMRLANIERKDVYISNIVKCRPPANRKPTPFESKTCTNLILFNQLEIINPQFICTLGSTALEGLLDRPVKMTQERGKTFIWNSKYTVLPTFHPAYILRNPSQLCTMVDDLCLIQKLVESKK